MCAAIAPQSSDPSVSGGDQMAELLLEQGCEAFGTDDLRPAHDLTWVCLGQTMGAGLRILGRGSEWQDPRPAPHNLSVTAKRTPRPPRTSGRVRRLQLPSKHESPAGCSEVWCRQTVTLWPRSTSRELNSSTCRSTPRMWPECPSGRSSLSARRHSPGQLRRRHPS